jgi:ATP-binding cassette subfamily F protein uup
MLAQALARPSNLLVLDEPTNDLDMETLEVLEEMLGEYSGTILLISHDRDFLDRLVNGVIAPEGDGRWTEYAGGYSDMLAQRGADLSRDRRKPEPRKVSKEAVSVSDVPEPAKRKMTFKDKHALETLPKTIAALQAEAHALQEKLSDPQLYARDRVAFEQASSELAALQHKIAAAEEQWLALEILREELAGDR